MYLLYTSHVLGLCLLNKILTYQKELDNIIGTSLESTEIPTYEEPTWSYYISFGFSFYKIKDNGVWAKLIAGDIIPKKVTRNTVLFLWY